jgi:hypothetical protein
LADDFLERARAHSIRERSPLRISISAMFEEIQLRNWNAPDAYPNPHHDTDVSPQRCLTAEIEIDPSPTLWHMRCSLVVVAWGMTEAL